MDITQYTSLYLQEMRDNLAQLNRHAVTLEKEPTNIPLLQEIMRLNHSGKGSSNAMGFKSTAELFHSLEDVFDAARKSKLAITKDIITLCLKAFDQIEASFAAIEKTKKEIDCSAIAAAVRASAQMNPAPATTQATTIDAATDVTVIPDTTAIDFIRVGTEKIEKLTNLAGEFALLRQHASSLKNNPEFASVLEQLTKLTDDLTYYAGNIRLVPLEQAFGRFPRLVRDLATVQGKNVRFEMTGTDVELDKTLVDHLISPLIHLLRNAVDHGMESPDVRKQLGKNPEGTIRLTVERDQGFARVTVEDDGEAIVLGTLKEIAKKKGFTDAVLDSIKETNTLDLLTMPGFSSSKTVSDISGRGVGLSAVHQAAKALGGQLTLTQSTGCKRFTVSLPLQLSIIQSLLVDVTGQTYALPLVHVRRLITVPSTQIQSTLGQQATVVDGQDVALISLPTLFKTNESAVKKEGATTAAITETHIVLVDGDKGLIGIVVDRVLGNADIMVKPIATTLKSEVCFTGSTIIGSGRVALILDVPGIVQEHTVNMKQHSPLPRAS